MKVPLRWLNDFVSTGLTPEALAHRLTMAGLEAEKIETIGAGWANVYVGVVERVERHPDADRLVLAEVNAGEHRLTVVTGAPNIAAGQKVALALAGARLFDTHGETPQLKTLKPGLIRGVRSEGMVCSEKELGLSEEHEGILVLEPEAPVGMPLVDWLGETVIEFEITPNLVHAFSILGIARETSALTGKPLKVLPTANLLEVPKSGERLVRIDAPELCARCTATVIEGVKVGPSPAWLVRRLMAAGLRPINNIVDVTNYLMIESGQPLHAYDRARLDGGGVIVRRAFPNEMLETLDHQRRELQPEMLVIADRDEAIGVAGVMGGVDSEVDATTTTILLEAANFNMQSVRQTARKLRLRTDASARFERGLDPTIALDAAARAAQLILEICPGSKVTAFQDVYPTPVQRRRVMMRFAEIERLLGVAYAPNLVRQALDHLGFAPEIVGDEGEETLTVRVPTYRTDVTQPADVVEEVARIIGYETLPETLPAGRATPVQRDPMALLQRRVRRLLVAAGAAEAVTYVALSEHEARQVGGDELAGGFLHPLPYSAMIRLRNPVQSDRGLMRPTLLPSLLAVTSANMKHETSVRFFELARVYLPGGAGLLPNEVPVAGIVMTGQRDPVDRFGASGEIDFFDLKGAVEAVVAGLGITDARFAPASHAALHPGRAASLAVGERQVGLLGELRPDRAAAFGLEDGRVCVAELDLNALLTLVDARATEIRVPRFLPVQQDFAVVVSEETSAADVERTLLAGGGALATGISLFDIYRGPQLGEGRKSLAYRLTFTAPDRALTDAELGKVRQRIAKVLGQRVGGELRA